MNLTGDGRQEFRIRITTIKIISNVPKIFQMLSMHCIIKSSQKSYEALSLFSFYTKLRHRNFRQLAHGPVTK